MSRSRLLRWAVLSALFYASPGIAHLPSTSRILGAVVAANRSAGRTEVLRIQVALRVGEGPVIGTGELLSDPNGRVRLELTSAAGLLERHLRTPGRYRATRNGSPLSDPRPFAPPLPLLQASSRSSLRAAFPAAAWSQEQVELGRVGDHDCWVVGGRSQGSADVRPGTGQAALWVDIESHAIQRIDLGPDSWLLLGPAQAFGPIVLPGWLQIHAGAEDPVRLEFVSAERAQVAPGSFEEGWLDGP